MKEIENQLIINHIPSNQLLKDNLEIYEVLRVANGIPLFVYDHLNRLKNSFLNLGVKFPGEESEFSHAIEQVINLNNITNQNIRISCIVLKNNVINSYIYPIKSNYPSAFLYSNGVKCSILCAERNKPNIKMGNTKVRSYANGEINKKNVFETLLVNSNGLITEGSRSNVFFIKGNSIFTAPNQIVLQGITRYKVIDIIARENYELHYKSVSCLELKKMDAAFLTGTSLQILPINEIDGYKLHAENKVLKHLMVLLKHEIEQVKKMPNRK